jgi:hypothetical protein
VLACDAAHQHGTICGDEKALSKVSPIDARQKPGQQPPKTQLAILINNEAVKTATQQSMSKMHFE